MAGDVESTLDPERYAVLGNPIAHSKSPWIHTMFASQTRQTISYTRLLVDIGGFAEAIARFWQDGGRGANVTVPFKEDAWRWVARRSERAERAGAVNTVVLQDNGSSLGDNTDGVGLVRDLSVNHGVGLEGLRVLILGAGGAARGVLAPVMGEKPASLAVANRTLVKANDLAREFSALGAIEASGFAELAGLQFDLIINATAAGLSGQVPPLPAEILAPGGCCYDMVYGDRPTAFVQWGRRQGAAKSIDGLGMLVEQAAESFLVWRGVRPETPPVIAALRAGQPARGSSAASSAT
jgi:shikimate dehydrogenase